MANKGGLRSPFNNQLLSDHGDAPSEGGETIDRNACPYFDQPRAPGHGGAQEVFFSGVKGKKYHGDKGQKAATISTPMSDQKKGE
jgi:hypothetical protein